MSLHNMTRHYVARFATLREAYKKKGSSKTLTKKVLEKELKFPEILTKFLQSLCALILMKEFKELESICSKFRQKSGSIKDYVNDIKALSVPKALKAYEECDSHDEGLQASLILFPKSHLTDWIEKKKKEKKNKDE